MTGEKYTPYFEHNESKKEEESFVFGQTIQELDLLKKDIINSSKVENNDGKKYNMEKVNKYLNNISKYYDSQKIKDKKAYTMAYQIALKSIGFNVGKIDGIYGKNTKGGIVEFQKNNSLQITGIFDHDTLRKYIDIHGKKGGIFLDKPGIGIDKVLTDREGDGKENEKNSDKSETIDFNPQEELNYYKELAIAKGKNLCSSFATGCAANIMQKMGKALRLEEVKAREIRGSSAFNTNFKRKNINNKNSIINAPAGSILTLRYNRTHATESGVSHAMVSLGGGVYTDLFGTRIRKMNLNGIKISDNKVFSDPSGNSFTITPDSCLMIPDINERSQDKDFSFPNNETERNQISPNEYADILKGETGLPKNFILSTIAKENKFTIAQLSKPQNIINIHLPAREIYNLKLKINDKTSNNIAKDFFGEITNKKNNIMKYFPSLTNHEYDNIAKKAIGILYQETNAGFSFDYMKKGIVHSSPRLEEIYRKKSGKTDEYSRGYTQIKLETNLGQNEKLRAELKSYGINEGTDLEDPKKSAIATMYFLIENYYTYIKPMLKDPDWISTPKDKQGNPVQRDKVTKENCFDYLYYTWNKPRELVMKTATPDKNGYVKNGKSFENQHLIDC